MHIIIKGSCRDYVVESIVNIVTFKFNNDNRQTE